MKPLTQDEIINKLYHLLPAERYRHVLGVAGFCAALAMKNGREDLDRFILAGLLHDCAKYMNEDELLLFAKEKNIEIKEFEKEYRFQLHAIVGEYLARTEYGIEDKEILEAIFCHTVGKQDMTFLEKTIYVADFLEPSRRFFCEPSLTKLREIAFEDLEQAMFLILQCTVEHVKKKYGHINPITEEVYMDYCKKGYHK